MKDVYEEHLMYAVFHLLYTYIYRDELHRALEYK